ncbi:hypothetical protein [Clostridium cellulovorans]|uniref:Uncharacterized protein n=1 Tax=Clostridium cellulovorans (strain ATCC 35296 / DSM 3052 / OCM 3 / 743B) TaxID=573061 RepID=D9SPK8_CLOC7|nr:hypothetical protein [Clostridium cellulovorans]ADL50057.1 hypothetical protein Clocel_0275 [Clostridium cellulovorans 743B]
MKKFILKFFFVLCLIFSCFSVSTMAQVPDLTEGLHKADNFNLSKDKPHYIQNTSPDSSAYVLILDGNENLQQTIRLKPQSAKYKLVPLEPGARIVIFGNGIVSIT